MTRTASAIVSLALTVLIPGAALAAENADPSAKAQAVVDKALAYLKGQQQADGGWQRSPREPVAISALVLKAAVQDSRHSARTDWVAKGYASLLKSQQDNGGIYREALANYNTAVAISSLAAAKSPDFNGQIAKAVAFLKTMQYGEWAEDAAKADPSDPRYGGSGYGAGSRPDASNTAIMLDALHDAGVPADDPRYKAALKFVTRVQNLSETNDQKWAGNDGGGIYTPVQGGQSTAGEYTDPSGKRFLRSYGSMTYAMLKSYIYCGLSKDDPRVKAAWDWVRKNWALDENPGMRAGNAAEAKAGMFYYYVTLARALNAYGEPIIVDPQGDKHDWRIELIAKLTSLQNEDGSFVGDRKWMEDNRVLATSFAVIALQEAQRSLAARPSR